jgi:hypothetical protein
MSVVCEERDVSFDKTNQLSTKFVSSGHFGEPIILFVHPERETWGMMVFISTDFQKRMNAMG